VLVLCSVISEQHVIGPFCPSVMSFSRHNAVVYQWSYEVQVLPYNMRMADQIFMKFCMDVIPLEANPSTFISYNQ
jgi:hypothetical protein